MGTTLLSPPGEVTDIRRAPLRLPGNRVLRRTVLILFAGLALVAAWQRGVQTTTHATFPIFRQSFPHLVAGTDLYDRYPAEQGTEERDRFKYTPSAAVVLAPLSTMPFLAGLLTWTLVNALAVYAAVRRLMPGREGLLAQFIVFPALIAAVQSTSSNGLMAALIVGTFVAIEAGQAWRAAMAVATATLMKLFPAAVLPFVLVSPKRWKMALAVVVVFAALLAAPLLVTSPGELIAQYRSWIAIILRDEGDLTFARSIMVVFREYSGAAVANWLFQGLATLILLTPLLLRRAKWGDAGFRRAFLASLLVYVVIFNHQSENASYVIASIGLALWFLSAERRTVAHWVLLLACMAGLEAVPYFLVWLWMQFDLLDGQRLVGWVLDRFDTKDAVPAPAVPASDPVEA
jgi:hypothetical protein